MIPELPIVLSLILLIPYTLIHLDDTVFDPVKCNETLVQLCQDNKRQHSLQSHNRNNTSYSNHEYLQVNSEKVVQTSK